MKTRKLMVLLLIVGMVLQCFASQNCAGFVAIQAAEDADIETEEGLQDAKQGDKLVFKGDTFRVTYEIISKWNTAYNASVTIENIGKKTIHDWALIFYSNDVITNLWNGTIANQEEGLYLVDNATWNMDIKEGQSVNFGYTAEYEDNIVIPPSYAISSCRREVAENDYNVEYTLYSDSGNMINSAISIENLTEEVIEDWGFEFDFEAEINNIWKAKILNDDTCNEEHHFILSNPGYEQNVEHDRNVEFGFLGKTEDSQNVPHNFKLTKYSNEIDYTLDSDNDGLTNVQEVVIGGNAYLSDTDEDGLDDYLEICYLYLLPNKKDTDGNGVEDGDEDTDEDGLMNFQELKYNCCGWEADTDEDGLYDGEEVYKYSTNPTKGDTDGDTLSDYDEVQIGLNPLKKDTDGNGVLDLEEKFKQSVTLDVVETEKVEITSVTVSSQITGNMKSNTTIKNVYDEDVVCSDVEGLVGVPIDITSSGKFEEATICFHYDKQKLSHEEDDLMIMWFDEENDTFVPMENTQVDVEKSTVSCTTTHFSKYFVVYYNEWINLWKNAPDYRNTSMYHDVLLSIDVSGSMKDNKLSKAKKGAKTLVNYMYKEDRMALMTYDNKAKLCQEFTCDPDVLKKKINAVITGGATDSDVGLKEAVNAFTKKSYVCTGNKKHVIILSDGALKYKKKIINKAKANDIVIHMILMSDDAKRIKKCKKIARKTGGKYYHVTSDVDIAKKMKNLSKYIFGEMSTKDSDGDGLYDVYEEMGMMTISGKLLRTNPNKSDSDSDSLTDGYEMTGKKTITSNLVKKQMIQYGGKTLSVYRFGMKSNPNEKDTDGDHDEDCVDPKPLVYQLNGRFVVMLKKLRNYAKSYLIREGRSVSEVNVLTCMYIRQFNESYTNATWDAVAGDLDEKFVNEVNTSTDSICKDIKNYFKNNARMYANKYEKEVDVYHLFATLGAEIYDSSAKDGKSLFGKLQYQIMPEPYINNLGGWAGDLQTLMNDVYDKAENIAGYENFYLEISNRFLNDDFSFSKEDLYADIDALNIARKINQDDMFISAFRNYYKTDYLKRYTIFKKELSKSNFAALVYYHVEPKFMGIVKWPLFKYRKDGKKRYRKYSALQSCAARDMFCEYVEACVQREK